MEQKHSTEVCGEVEDFFKGTEEARGRDHVGIGLPEKEPATYGSCKPASRIVMRTTISSRFGLGVRMTAKWSKKTLKKSVEGSQ
jgi:hypothetical protein